MRHSIRAEIGAIAPHDELERTHIADTLAWIDSGAELCRLEKPATPPRHLVSYVVVVDGDHLLLVDHRNARLWLPPGGHVEPGEHPRTTAAREMAEELGFPPPHPIAAPLMLTCATTVGRTAGHTDVSLWYVVRASRAREIRFDAGEFETVCWFPFSQVPLQRSDPHLARLLAKLGAQA